LLNIRGHLATVHIAGSGVGAVEESGRSVVGDPGVTHAQGARGEVVVTVGSGHYVFVSSRSTGPDHASSSSSSSASSSSISTAIIVSAVAVAALVAAGVVGFGPMRRRRASPPDLFFGRLRPR